MALLTVPLEELGKISQGITASRYANSQGTVYRLVSVTDLEGLYIRDTQASVQVAVSDIQRYLLRENDVVIAIRGSILKSSVVTKALQSSISNQNTVFFRPKFVDLDPLYLAVLLRSEYFRQLPSFRERQSTTTLPAIRVSDLRSLKIPLPDPQTQAQIAQLFLSIEQAKKVVFESVETRQRLANAALVKALGV
ncbi:restriction endonuclease subunit S [Leptolyngbya sp. AN02str]|uniref:restriction endonuclease subunit S n=1 Tax=Leptolyngbya sp. AN02str TaxID=3423363 RepID=UPI003D32045E